MPRCSALYNHEFISIDGTRLPCCRFIDLKSEYTANNSSISEYHNSDFIRNIKQDMETGWHPGCNRCKVEEEAGQDSLRNLYNLDHSFSDNIESIEFSLSNKCNLVCRMCNPVYSTKWQSFLLDNPELKDYVGSSKEFNPVLFDKVFKNRDLSNLKFIKYLGGEPFITPEIAQLFKLLDEQNLLPNINFFCSTNATLFPSKYIKYLKKFKFIRMDISLEGTNGLNEYIRHGKPWSNILSTLNLWKEYKEKNNNIDLSIFTTIQAYNIHDINNLMQLSNTLQIGFRGALLSKPRWLSLNSLPPAYVNTLSKVSQEYFKDYQFNEIDFHKLKDYTNKFDKSSNMYMKDIIPELWKEMQNAKL